MYWTTTQLITEFGVSYYVINGLIRRGIIAAEDYEAIGAKYSGKGYIFNENAYNVVQQYVNPSPDWVSSAQIAASLNRTQGDVNVKINSIPNIEHYRHPTSNGKILYDPIVIDLFREMFKSERVYVRLVKPVPDKEWFTPREFGSLFDKKAKAVYCWIQSHLIPSTLVTIQTGKRYHHYLIHKSSVEYIDGKAYSIINRQIIEPEPDEPLIWRDGYELTESQHKRRREIFNKHFPQNS